MMPKHVITFTVYHQACVPRHIDTMHIFLRSHYVDSKCEMFRQNELSCYYMECSEVT